MSTPTCLLRIPPLLVFQDFLCPRGRRAGEGPLLARVAVRMQPERTQIRRPTCRPTRAPSATHQLTLSQVRLSPGKVPSLRLGGAHNNTPTIDRHACAAHRGGSGLGSAGTARPCRRGLQGTPQRRASAPPPCSAPPAEAAALPHTRLRRQQGQLHSRLLRSLLLSSQLQGQLHSHLLCSPLLSSHLQMPAACCLLQQRLLHGDCVHVAAHRLWQRRHPLQPHPKPLPDHWLRRHLLRQQHHPAAPLMYPLRRRWHDWRGVSLQARLPLPLPLYVQHRHRLLQLAQLPLLHLCSPVWKGRL